MSKKLSTGERAKRAILIQTIIGCFFIFFGAITCFSFGSLMLKNGDENAQYVFMAGIAFLIFIPVVAFLTYRQFFKE